MKFKDIFTWHRVEIFILAGLFFFSLIYGMVFGNVIYSLNNLTGIKALEQYRPEIPTRIYDVKDRLISEYFLKKRILLTFDDLPQDLLDALIVKEDREFYRHKGINPAGIARAFLVNLAAGRIRQGGSTLTQQLAKVLFTSQKRTYFRKIKEVWLALQIEKLYTKNEILEMYFNQIYFGHGAYGIEAASRFYFSKGTSDLNFAECLLMAILPNAPNYYSPLRNPEVAMKHHLRLMRKMVKLGYIGREEADREYYDFWTKYLNQSRTRTDVAWNVRLDKAPYFTEYIRRRMNRKLGENKLYGDGFKIYTTLDLDLQRYAQQSLWAQLKQLNSQYHLDKNRIKKYFDENIVDTVDLLSLVMGLNSVDIGEKKTIERFRDYFTRELLDPLQLLGYNFSQDSMDNLLYIVRNKGAVDTGSREKVEGAIVSVEPKTGRIVAMVGGSGFSSDNQLNRVVQMRRQAGSAFKPFVYAAAIDSGYFTPGSVIIDSPIVYTDKDGNNWIPNNYSGRYHGRVTLRRALQKSINIVSIKLADTMGLDSVLTMSAKLLHILSDAEQKERLKRNLSVALGTIEVSPLEMATAYAVLANQGEDVIPYTIRNIKDRYDNLIEDDEQKVQEKPNRRILTPQVAYIMTDLLQEILKPGGTAWGAVGRTGFSYRAAGKTGTTDNWKDAWFLGFTPELSTAVWIGFDHYGTSLGVGNTGGRVAAPVWAEYMQKALSKYPNTPFSEVDGLVHVRICGSTGLLPSEKCKDVYEEIFIRGSEPDRICEYCAKEGTGEGDYELRDLSIDMLKGGHQPTYRLLER